jgi:hypothetical protein
MNSMTALIKTYSSEAGARQAAETLRAAAVPPRHIRLLTGRPLRDIRREPRGGFAGPVGPDAPAGSYASVPRRRGQATGSFATGSFTGDPERQRKGSFGDVERVVLVTYTEDAERRRVTSHRGLRRLLRSAGLDDHGVDRARDELNLGHAIVLADVAGIAPSGAQGGLEQVAQAA